MILGSVRAESMAASRVEQALSEVASSLGSIMLPRQGPQQTWMLQTQIWLHLGRSYLFASKTLLPIPLHNLEISINMNKSCGLEFTVL